MAQRVNKRFLIILTIVLTGIVAAFAGVVLVSYYMLHHKPQDFAGAGDAAAQGGNWELAAGNYGRAISLGRADPDLYIRNGVALEHCVGANPDSLKQAENSYQNALVVDPSNISAARHLLEMHIQLAEVAPSAAAFGKLRDSAQKVVQLDSSDQRAAAYQHVGTILLSERASGPSARSLTDDFDALAKIVRRDPSDSNLAYYYARGKLRLATLALKDQNPDAAAHFAQDVGAFFDEVLATKGDDAALNWRASTSYALLPRFDPAGAAADDAKAGAALARAKALARPSDPRFADIQVAVAMAAASHQKLDDAETILRDLYTAMPKSPVAQLQLSGFLGRFRGKRTEAIAVLSTPITGSGEVGAVALRTRGQEQERIYQLSRLQLELYTATTDQAAKQKLLAQIDSNYKSLADLIGQRDSHALLHLKAEIQQVKGDLVGAVATYHQALTVMEHADAPDIELMYHAGLLDAREGQSGEAEKLFLRVIDIDPGFTPPQVALADQYLRENNPEKAQPYIDSAEKVDPGSALIAQLRIRQLVQQRQPEAARAMYAKLPEADVAQQVQKAKVALLVGDAADAKRLLEPIHKQSPADTGIVALLVQAYVASDQRDQAKAMIDEGLAQNPKDVWLLILRQQLNAPADARLDVLDPQLLAATDDFTRALIGYETELKHQKYDAAAAHLAEADRIKPDNPRVHVMYFELDLARRRFDLAEQEVTRLSAMQADGADGMLYRIRLALAKGDYAGAVQTARDLTTRRPQFAESYSMLGAALLAAGQPDKAVLEFNNALDRQHDNVGALQGLIDAYLQLHQTDRAAQAILTAQQFYPQSGFFRERAIDYDLRYSDHPEEGVAERKRLLDAAPDDPAAHAALAQAALRVANRLQTSNPAVARQNLDLASLTLNNAAARWPRNIVIVGLLAQLRQYRGDAAAAEKLLLDLASVPEMASAPEPSLLLAEFYRTAGKADAQIKALNDAFEKSGHSVDVELALGAALAQTGQYDQALSLLRDQNGTDTRVVLQRLHTLSAAGRTDDAVRDISAALQSSPRSVELLDLLATTYIAAGRISDARQVAKDAIAANPLDNDALYHQALIESQLIDGDLELAMRDASQLKAQNPASAKAYGMLADIYYRRRQTDDALRTLEDGLKADPQDQGLRLRLLNAYSASTPPAWSDFDRVVHEAENDTQLRTSTDWLVKDAYGLAARKQFDAAVQKIDAAIAAAPDRQELISDKLSILMTAENYPAVIQTADALEARGVKPWWVYMARGAARSKSDKSAGIIDLDAALAAAPDFASSARVVRMIASSAGVDEALRRAKSRPDDPNWRLMAADLDAQKGDFADAITQAAPLRTNTVISQAPRLHALSLLAESYRIMHQPRNARDVYLEAVAIAPNDPELLNNVANVVADDLHDPQQALTYSQRAYDVSRQSGVYLLSISDTHGWVLTLCGGAKAASGLDILQKLVQDHQDFTYARYHLGEAYLRSSMPLDAVKQLEIAQGQLQQAEEQHAQVNAELKSAIAESLTKARQVIDGKADAGGK